MKQPAASNYTLQNGVISEMPVNENIFDNREIIYEVFRIEQGIPLFIDDHLQRLYSGIDQCGYQFSTDQQKLKTLLSQLAAQSKTGIGNIKTECFFKQGETRERGYHAYFLSTNYPDNHLYQDGVHCQLLEKSRPLPSVKIANPALRKLSDSIIQQENVFETILHHNGIITEGSRSNLFFVKDNTLITAPDELVLPGVMRKKILQLINEKHYSIKMTALKVSELNSVDAAFITGTSPRILPILKIQNIVLNPLHPIIISLRNGISQLIQNEIESRQ
ncbi:aminotransferase class IV [Geofilum sp. OHC36d9]|uniref:aminotransferase class IV n=1 Tax=Geofilum sp. OHC36d9 TaxID=3458413 RepID=UPI0040348376